MTRTRPEVPTQPALRHPPSPAGGRPPRAVPRGATRRQVGAGLIAGTAVLAAACDAGQAPATRPSAALSGTFELLHQNWAPLNTILERVTATFQQKNPQAKVSLVPIAYGELAPKVRASVAAGAGPDGFHTYSDFWRGINAATMMLPLSPQVFRRNELEQMAFPNLLNSVWAKNNETYIIPYAVGVNGAVVLYNQDQLSAAAVDPKGFTSLNAIVAAATRLVRREGSTITRAGLLFSHTPNYAYNWVLDQGAKFYDERTSKWTWQTAEAERAVQWLLDLYDKHAVTWRTAPPGVANATAALGEGHASMSLHGAYALSGFAASHKDTKLADQPLPAFVPSKQPTYYLPEISGFALSALLKPDDPRARLGAAFYRELYSPEGGMVLANEYTGAILLKGVYSDPRFKDTRFAATRARFGDQVIARTVMINAIASDATPPLSMAITKVINGELSIKAALADLQQTMSAKEEEALRTRG